MRMDYTKTPTGDKDTKVCYPRPGWTLNLSQYAREIEAIQKPKEKITYYHVESSIAGGIKYEYDSWAIYDPETMKMETNWLPCPNCHHHHLYQTCSVCKQEG